MILEEYIEFKIGSRIKESRNRYFRRRNLRKN